MKNVKNMVALTASLGLFGCAGGDMQDMAEGQAPGSVQQAASVVNTHPEFLMVYNVNYENLPTASDTCAGDWQDLIYYMKTQTYSPDVFIVHQMSGAAQAAQLAQFMTDNLVGVYSYVVAQDNTAAFNSP